MLSLDVPKAIMSIDPLKDNVLNRFKSAADETKKNADEEKTRHSGYFPPLSLETKWQITFENKSVISISGITYEYQGGAHPDTYFQTIVWDKINNRDIPITELFRKDKVDLALKAIAESAQKSWIKIYTQRTGEKPSPDLVEQTKQEIASDPKFLKNYTLTHAKGHATINGIELLYGTGEIWPYVLGEFRIPVPLAVFSQYLASPHRESLRKY
ncbi:MAG: DUF3298 and DUF4163 domain-containing protein [Gammaproteobacteria bacterium]|nr:DUF3298 and DUF4163 domain-containing protein [Gammaproteobacteria bacterium]